MSYITVNKLWKQFDDNIILEDVNVNVEQDSFITLVGTSGCGKSTFLNLLLGILQPSQGSITLEDQPIKAEPDGERGIVFQKYSVFPHLSVRDNVLIALELPQSPLIGRLFGTARTRALDEVDQLIDRVGLGHASQRYPHELSGGMQQRLAIAQAMIAKPKVLLLDEPFGALDPGIRNDMHILVRELWEQENLTIFMVTHDLKEAFTLGTRLWVFDKVRHDPQAPNHYGAQITYDLDLTAQSSTLDEDSYLLGVQQSLQQQAAA